MATSMELAHPMASKLPLLPQDIEEQTVAAYDRLASEYDSPEHATTRKLERLSIDMCAGLLSRNHLMENAERILEIGCGTGTLSKVLIELLDKGSQFVLSDASPAMIKLAQGKIEPISKPRLVQYLQLPIFSVQADSNLGTFDLVVCGMADPYFLSPALDNIRRYCAKGAHLLVTLPEESWAMTERQYRLKVPMNQTRFRLLTGEVVVSFSFVYSVESLSQLLTEQHFELLELDDKSEALTYPPSNRAANPVRAIGALARLA